MQLLIVHRDPEMGEALVQMVKSYTRHQSQLVRSNSETLAVTYIRPKSKAKSAESDLAAAAAAVNPAKKGKPVKASPPPEGGSRKYPGYIVRVYYNDQLQDKRAEPTKLLTLFAAPNTAPPQ